MARRIQQIIFILLFPIMSYAQCDTTEVKLVKGKCDKVIMSVEMFTVYHTYKKNLELVGREIVVLQSKVDSLKAVNDNLYINLEKQIEALKIEKAHYEAKITEITTENIELKDKVDTLKKRQPKILGIGFGLGLLLLLIAL